MSNSKQDSNQDNLAGRGSGNTAITNQADTNLSDRSFCAAGHSSWRTSVLAFFFFTRKIPVIQEEVPSLNYYWVPLVTVIFGSYMIAHGFFNVYAMCVDTLFLCFLWDLEAHDGSPRRPYYMNKSLKKILKKTNDETPKERSREKTKVGEGENSPKHGTMWQ